MEDAEFITVKKIIVNKGIFELNRNLVRIQIKVVLSTLISEYEMRHYEVENVVNKYFLVK